jgi:hypothetical protein
MDLAAEKISTFALMVDKLRQLNEAELKLAYIKLFKEEIKKDWKELVDEMELTSATEEEISDAFYKMRQEKK